MFFSLMAQTSTQEFIDRNRDLSELLDNSFNNIWQTTINSNLFTRAAFFGGTFGVFALAIFAYQWLQYQLGDRGYLDWSKIILPGILIILLSKPEGQPVVLGKFYLGLREIGNGISTELLNLLSEDLSASQAADVAAAKTMMELIGAQGIQTCAAITEEQVRNDCFVDAERQVINIVNQYRDVNPTVENWATRTGREIIRKIQDAQGVDYATSQWFGRLFGGMGGSLQAANNFAVPILFLAMGTAYYYILEYVGLLTVLTSPIFLGTSLYSIGHKPFFLSLSVFMGIWLARLCYSLLIGFTGLIMSITPTTSTLLFPLIAGMFGPVISFLMGVGGGLGMFSVFTGAGVFALSRR